MTNAELLQLNPQHLAELSSFLDGFPFDQVDIIAKEIGLSYGNTQTGSFNYELNRLHFDGVFRGKNHTHSIFTGDEDNVFYCVSYARIGGTEERIIFRLSYNT